MQIARLCFPIGVLLAVARVAGWRRLRKLARQHDTNTGEEQAMKPSKQSDPPKVSAGNPSVLSEGKWLKFELRQAARASATAFFAA